MSQNAENVCKQLRFLPCWHASCMNCATAPVKDQVTNEVWNKVWEQVGTQVRDKVLWESIGS